MGRSSTAIDVITRKPVVWPPEHLHDATLRWLRRLLASAAPTAQVGKPPTDLEALIERIRIGPWTEPLRYHSPHAVGLWWHENPDRNPVILERFNEDERHEALGPRAAPRSGPRCVAVGGDGRSRVARPGEVCAELATSPETRVERRCLHP